MRAIVFGLACMGWPGTVLAASTATSPPSPNPADATLRSTTDVSATPAPIATTGDDEEAPFSDTLLRDALGPTGDQAPMPVPVPRPATAPTDTSGTERADAPIRPVQERAARVERENQAIRAIGRTQRLAPADDPETAPGIRVGTFVLRPEITEGVGVESRRFGAADTNRSYLQTTLKGTLTSDWDRHALTVTGDGVLQNNISGTGATQPQADIAADLRLDLAGPTTSHLTAGYSLFREDTTDPNALVDATSQSTVQVVTGGASLTRDLGLLRGTVSAQALRTTYGDAELADGSRVSQSDRNTTAGLFKARLDFANAAALRPFLQASYQRTSYDQSVDAGGYRRSSDTYVVEAGLAADFGEKLSGELAAGYTLRSFEDRRLSDVDGLAVDGTMKWSPHRGTDIALGVTTALEDSTTPGQSGPIAYGVNATLTQQLRDTVVAHLGAGYIRRIYVADIGVPDEDVYSAEAGVTWYLTHYLGIDGAVTYEQSHQPGQPDQKIATATLGLTVRR